LEAQFLGLAPNVDPQMQGRGFLFMVGSNAGRLSPGEAVVGYLKVPGEPLAGVIVPRQAVVRTEGSGWVYVLDANGAEAFTRTEISLDHPTDAGYFVGKGVGPGDYIVVNGAQDLLSIELKGQGGEE
jgi:multidrug efflux pump subunit AcrA (membrane-fusion protein)